MKKALISSQENNRIAEVAATAFPVAASLFWVDCSDEVTTAWTYDNGVFVPPSEPVAQIPTSVSMRQARLALLQAGLLDAVDAAVSAGSDADKISWEFATEVRRNDPLVINLSAYLDLSQEDLDNLFTLAASL